MPTCKKKKTESRVRRTRRTRRVRLTQRTRRVRRVRLTRKRKGGNLCEKGIHGYDDNHECVEAGCDKFMCAKIYRGSKPHKNLEDAYNAKLEAEREAEREAKRDREKRRETRRNERNKLKGPLSSAIAAQTQSSQERLSALMDELSIGANENANANPNATNPTNKNRTLSQGWNTPQLKWAEGLPQTYKSSYTPPRP